MAGCEHARLRLVTFEEEPKLDERARRPFTCEDCNGDARVPTSRFTIGYVLELLLKERAHGLSRRR